MHTAWQIVLTAVAVPMAVYGLVVSEQRLFAVVGGVLLVTAILWRIISRDSAEPDVVRGAFELGDGTAAEGERFPQPRSKKIAAGTGASLIGLGAGAMALAGGDTAALVLLGLSAVLMLGLGGMNLWQARHPNWLGLSPAGVTVHALGSHFTLAWQHVEKIDVWHLQGNRMFGVWGDLTQAEGHVSRWTRATSSRRGGKLPAIVLPATLFDLDLDEILEAADRWAETGHSPQWPTSESQGSSDSTT